MVRNELYCQMDGVAGTVACVLVIAVLHGASLIVVWRVFRLMES